MKEQRITAELKAAAQRLARSSIKLSFMVTKFQQEDREKIKR